MWFPVSMVAALCVLLDLVETSHSDNDLEVMFRDRSDSDWEEAWHKEKYTRCRQKLIKHLYWACEKDIYRVTRRNDPQSFNYLQNNDYEEEYPWITPKKAKKMLRFKRGLNKRAGGSITAECCKSSGCTWEEYAEYCPTNKRYTSYV